jgi:hypothetical protein
VGVTFVTLAARVIPSLVTCAYKADQVSNIADVVMSTMASELLDCATDESVNEHHALNYHLHLNCRFSKE